MPDTRQTQDPLHHSFANDRVNQPIPRTLASLPNEILDQIFTYVIYSSTSICGGEIYKWLHLSLVCSSWKRQFEPLLYRALLLRDQTEVCRVSNELLAFTLKDRPELGDYVKNLDIIDFYGRKRDLNTFAMIIGKCPLTRNLWIETTFNSSREAMIVAASQLRHVESIHLASDSCGPSVECVLAYFATGSLQKLDLQEFGENYSGNWVGSTLAQSYRPSLSPQLKHELSVRRGKAPFTCLALDKPHSGVPLIRDVILWPSQLTKLRLGSMFSPPWQDYTSLAMQELLEIHKATLQFIELGWPGQGEWEIPRFADFERLSTLLLHHRFLFGDSAGHVASKLSAPLLRDLCITAPEGRNNVIVHDYFGFSQLNWISEFASQIRLHPGEICPSLTSVYLPFFSSGPCYLLNEAACVLASCNVKMMYGLEDPQMAQF